MRYLLALALALPAAGAPLAADAGVLVTPGYAVVVAGRCPEGDAACADVAYTGVGRRTGAALTLRGKAFSSPCRDGATPCRHLGWRFASGNMV